MNQQAGPHRLVKLIARHVRESAERHLRAGAVRDFFLDLLSEANPLHAQYLAASGLNTIARFLGASLPEDADERIVAGLARRAAVATAYYHCENISDNLLIGTASDLHPGHALKAEREAVTRRLNDSMLRVLAHEPVELHGAFAPVAGRAGRISWVDSGLVPTEMRALLDGWSAQRGDPKLASEVEHSVVDILVWNVAACADFARLVDEAYPAIASLFRDGLRARYTAANVSIELLEQGRPIHPRALTEIGIDTVLVEPTLWFYSALIRPAALERFEAADARVREDWRRLFRHAALQTRLLNDLGALLSAPEEDFDALAALLHREQEANNDGLERILVRAHASFEKKGLLARLIKDVTYGEFNVALMLGASGTGPVQTFIEGLRYWRGLHERTEQELRALAVALAPIAGKEIPAIAAAWVQFHAKLYSVALGTGAQWDYYY